ncbi:hypothetical protein D3C87_1155520 [compost metagenome]
MLQGGHEVLFFDVFRAHHQFRVAWLGHELAEPGQQQALVAHVLGQQTFEAVECVALDLVRIGSRQGVGVGVAFFVRQELAEEVGEVGQHFSGARCAEADRVSHALINGNAAMGQAWRQVEHVARFQHPLIGGFEFGEDAQVGVGQHRALGVAHLADLPVALAVALQQEHVVVVEVRTNAATRCGVADHHVVDAPARQKAEIFQQFADFRDELIHGLHQQGPVTFRQLAEFIFGERAATQFPRTLAILDDQSRFDFFFQRQAGQFVGVDRAFEIRNCLTDQQRLFLPVVAQEFPCRDAAQKLKRNIRIHV